MKNNSINIFICILVFTCIAFSVQAQQVIKLRILETTDLHGSFFSYNMMKDKPTVGGLSRFAHLVDSLRTDYGDRLIVLDNGDILQGQPSAYWANYVDTLGTHLNAAMLNFIGYNAVTIGNHDIETGHSVYDRWANQLDCPVLGANVIDSKTGIPYFKPYTILKRDGVKVCVFGMITSAVPAWLPEKLWSGMRFEGLVKTAKKWIPIIMKKEKPDVIIGLFHSGSQGGIHNNHFVENEVKSVAQEVGGFDAIFFGHDHRKQFIMINDKYGKKIPLINPAAHGHYVGNLDLTISIEHNRVVNKKTKGSIVDIRYMPSDSSFNKRFAQKMSRVKSFVNQQIGVITSDLDAKDVLWGSSAYVDFIHELQLDITGADISITAPQSLFNKISAGPVYMKDMFRYICYENFLYTMNLRGSEIRDELEYSYNLWLAGMQKSSDHLLLLREGSTTDLKNFSFNFDSAAGIDYEVDVRKPYGQRVRVLCMSDGRAFDLNAMYKVAISSYRGNGGGELLTKGSGLTQGELSQRLIQSTPKDVRHYLIKYLLSNKKVTPRALHNWKFVPEKWTNEAAKRDSVAFYK